MTLTLAQATAVVTSGLAVWLMIRAGSAKHVLTIKTGERCASCGRRRERGRCPCMSSREDQP